MLQIVEILVIADANSMKLYARSLSASQLGGHLYFRRPGSWNLLSLFIN